MINRTGLVSVTFRKLTPEKIIELVSEAGLNAIEWGGDVHVPHGDLKRAAEVDADLDEWGVMCPGDMSLMVARQQFIKMYPRMGEILHLLGSSSLMALPTEADFEGPVADDITKYLETDFSSAKDRVRLFRA